MGLEIQGAVNSMMASANQIHAQNEENVKKALSIALGGVTGGAAGAAKAAVQESSLGSAAKTALIGDEEKGKVGLIDNALSPQAQAAQMADTSAQNEVEAKKAQRAKIDALPTSFGVSVGELPEKMKNKVYEEYEKNGRNL